MGREYMLPHIHSPSCQGASWWNADDGNLSPSPLQHLLLLHLLQPNSLLLLLFTPHLHIYPFIHPFFCISKKKGGICGLQRLYCFLKSDSKLLKKYETQPILQTFKGFAPIPEEWQSEYKKLGGTLFTQGKHADEQMMRAQLWPQVHKTPSNVT